MILSLKKFYFKIVKKPTLSIFHNNFTYFDYYRFRLNKIKKNYTIEYVNLSELLNYNFKNTNFKKKIIYVQSFRELYKYLKSKKNILILDNLGISFKLKKNLVRILINIYAKGILPVIGLRYRVSSKYVSSSFKENVEKIFNSLNKVIFEKIVFKNYYVILSGKYRQNFYSNLSKNKKYFTYSADYQRFLDIKKHFQLKKKYAVFLEENLVDHPDYYNSSHGFPPITKKEYYHLMNKFFFYFKKKFKCNIIVASHPKSKINEVKKNFKGLRVYSDNTQNLIKNSFCVFGHASTSISYPVIFKKPLIFISFSKIDNHFVGREINYTSKLLGSKLIYLDKSFELKNFRPKINKLKYNSYFSNFLKHPKSKNISFDNIFNFKLKF